MDESRFFSVHGSRSTLHAPRSSETVHALPKRFTILRESSVDALTFIEKNGKTRRQPFYVVAGDEDFLKRRVLALLPGIVLGDVDPEFASTNFPGDKTDFSTVRNELDAVSFFSERRLVVIDQADPFITKNRAALEEYVDNPAEKGVLVLEAKTFPATTKLYKAIPEASLILCKAPADHKLPAWCVAWCQAQYGKKLATAASQLLVELVGTSMGILDQELHKLTDFVGALPVIEAKHVDELVGRSRGANVFGIIEAIGNAQPTTALKILTELFEQGEEPMKLMGAIGYQLRKLARVARL